MSQLLRPIQGSSHYILPHSAWNDADCADGSTNHTMLPKNKVTLITNWLNLWNTSIPPLTFHQCIDLLEHCSFAITQPQQFQYYLSTVLKLWQFNFTSKQQSHTLTNITYHIFANVSRKPCLHQCCDSWKHSLTLAINSVLWLMLLPSIISAKRNGSFMLEVFIALTWQHNCDPSVNKVWLAFIKHIVNQCIAWFSGTLLNTDRWPKSCCDHPAWAWKAVINNLHPMYYFTHPQEHMQNNLWLYKI